MYDHPYLGTKIKSKKKRRTQMRRQQTAQLKHTNHKQKEKETRHNEK